MMYLFAIVTCEQRIKYILLLPSYCVSFVICINYLLLSQYSNSHRVAEIPNLSWIEISTRF